MEINLTAGSYDRLSRIMRIRQCSADEALGFALTCGWLAAEKIAMREEERMAKDGNKQPDNKAPNTGSNKGADNKATATGKPYPPNRPKAD